MPFYKSAATLTLRDNGGTFTRTGVPFLLTDGYMVGGLAPTRKLTVARESIATIAAELEYFAGENIPADADGVYLGTWVDEGVLYIDASEWVAEYYEAHELAAARGELAIWDNHNKVSLPALTVCDGCGSATCNGCPA